MSARRWQISPIETAASVYLGSGVFLLSFFLPAVGDLRGWQCAVFAATSWTEDDKISRLALFGGWLNPLVLVLFFLSVFRVAAYLRALLAVTILFSIPMTWIAIYRMSIAGMAMNLQVGHFLWVLGIALIAFPTLPLAAGFPILRWVAAAGAGALALLAVPLVIALTMRPASERDDFLYVVAWTLKEPALCGKIDARAIGRRDQSTSTDLTYMQSDCYRNVAAMIHNPQLCEHVKSAGADRLIGSPFAQSECREQKSTVGSAMPTSGPGFVRAMQYFGVSDEYLAQIHYAGRPDLYLFPILDELQTDPSFLGRLQAAPNYSEPFAPQNQREANALELLYETVAVKMSVPDLCRKISPNAQPHNRSPYMSGLRGSCFANIAYNRRDNALCQELPHTTDFQETNQTGFLESCVKNVAVLRNPDSNLQRAQYGPAVYPTWPQFRDVMLELGYPGNADWLKLPRPTNEEYENYVWDLATLERKPARDEFVSRVLATK
jgi:hypothetical protein